MNTSNSSQNSSTYSASLVIANIIKKQKPGFAPKLGIILGSGSGAIADKIENPSIIPYAELPKFHTCTVDGHAGNIYLGTLNGLPVVCLQGRAHNYEGVSPYIMKTLIRPLKLIGCDTIFLTSAVGSLNPEMPTGSLVAISDHINLQGTNPLCGPNDDEFGPRFVAMENAYDKDLRNQVIAIAKRLHINLPEAIYLSVLGPCFETPAEIRAFRTLGADVVGMSMAPDTILARHCGLKVIAISTVTNLAAGLNPEILSHEETLRVTTQVADTLASIIKEFCGDCANAKL